MKNLGQHFIIGIKDKILQDEEKIFLKENNIGGIILFSHNYSDPAQLAELINEIQICRDEFPLFISVDQEGGRVLRFKKHFTQFPAMYDISRLDSPTTIFEVHSIFAKELAACGVNVSFSPVCDIWLNPQNKVIGDRAFGTTAQSCEKFVSAAIRGLQTENILPCAKHFPGHGSTKKDSHFDLPYVSISYEQWLKEEFIPFAKASKSKAPLMMMSHIVFDAFDKELPCTLSKNAYRQLRETLRFRGLIVTDDMEMKAIADKYSTGEAALMALNAGADLLIYRSFEEGKKSYIAVTEALKDKKINKSELEEKQNKILALKEEKFSKYRPIYIPDLEAVFSSVIHKNYFDQLMKKIHEISLKSVSG